MKHGMKLTANFLLAMQCMLERKFLIVDLCVKQGKNTNHHDFLMIGKLEIAFIRNSFIVKLNIGCVNSVLNSHATDRG